MGTPETGGLGDWGTGETGRWGVWREYINSELRTPNSELRTHTSHPIPFSKLVDEMGKKTRKIGNVRYHNRKKGNKYMTPSLANFLWSLVLGTVIVVIPATIGLIVISQSDKIKRNS